MIESILILTFCAFLTLANRFPKKEFFIPYTASCFPLLVILFVRFLMYKSIRAFKNTLNFLNYLIHFLLINLIINFCLKKDKFFKFELIALLWPFYGLLALFFILFMGSFIIFMSTVCSVVEGSETEIRRRDLNGRSKTK
jgi:hypothetical protein